MPYLHRHPLTHPPTHPLTHSLTHPLTHSLTHSLIHSLLHNTLTCTHLINAVPPSSSSAKLKFIARPIPSTRNLMRRSKSSCVFARNASLSMMSDSLTFMMCPVLIGFPEAIAAAAAASDFAFTSAMAAKSVASTGRRCFVRVELTVTGGVDLLMNP